MIHFADECWFGDYAAQIGRGDSRNFHLADVFLF